MAVKFRKRTIVIGILLAVTACEDKPFHVGRTFVCETFTASFANDGQSVLVDVRTQHLTLRRTSTFAWFEDTYRGQGYELVADPEIELRLPDGSALGPCGY